MPTNNFQVGSVLVFEPKNLSKEYWSNLYEENKLKNYGRYGYGKNKLKHFVLVCPIVDLNGDTGHCLLWDMEDQKMIQMAHTYEFRMATEEEF